MTQSRNEISCSIPINIDCNHLLLISREFWNVDLSKARGVKRMMFKDASKDTITNKSLKSFRPYWNSIKFYFHLIFHSVFYIPIICVAKCQSIVTPECQAKVLIIIRFGNIDGYCTIYIVGISDTVVIKINSLLNKHMIVIFSNLNKCSISFILSYIISW